MSWVRVPVRVVSVARKLSTMKERRPDQSCLSRRGDYRHEYHNHENMSWDRVPVRVVCLARKLSTIENRQQSQSCLGEEIT
jgi:hypothetical protein